MLYDPNKNHLVLTFIVFPLDDPLLTFRKLLIHSQNSKPFSLSLFEIIAMNYIFQLALWNIYAIPKLQTPGAENIHFPAVDVRFHTAHNFYFLTKSTFYLDLSNFKLLMKNSCYIRTTNTGGSHAYCLVYPSLAHYHKQFCWQYIQNIDVNCWCDTKTTITWW